MELLTIMDNEVEFINPPETLLHTSMHTERPFIVANTIEITKDEMQSKHIIPVFLKDNEVLISHVDFIDATVQAVAEAFHGEMILKPYIRLSHEIRGRVPQAKNKPANELEEWEKTLYYERMAFAIEIPSIQDDIDGNLLSLTVGGVKSYGLDNLNSKSGADQHFKIFIGFKNTVCTNMCIFSDGLIGNLKVQNIGQLKACIKTLLTSYDAPYHLFHLNQLSKHFLTQQQFAHIIGRVRMYPYLSKKEQAGISPLLLGDGQINTVVRDYYKDQSFCRSADGSISLWKFYNLLTGSNKSSYIEQFLERSVNAFSFTEQLRLAMQNNTDNWYLIE